MTKNNNKLISNEYENIKNESISTLSKLINLYDLTLSESRLFSIMFLENNPMTLDVMSQLLGMSKTSMSMGIHSLLDNKMVEKVWKKGTRKDLYIVEQDLYKVFSDTFLDEWNFVIKRNLKTFNELLIQLNNLSTKSADSEIQESILQYQLKIDSIITFYKWLSLILVEIQGKIEDRQV
ncbi:DNA-binding transcriptional regulator GbsR (MarR family) [Sedimentibacter acidaminivorans]|jgi:DNA-binding transcriptional regulator GbsR (MarR family)|uniref:HTH-type transcriptional regulator n=1 Tax=Sedimentibacter acidaminivorans TaxID=913099 RepID=A0ABS4GDA2_9FIRM|nr:GbsR/MarR family transcriptional regulator [Sedimentibacter acidaminivorans]MBP1925676.1 DNA-binding transcriptional regulator GbsR (MarR family) [Sedimentibacter acidaminivorans]